MVRLGNIYIASKAKHRPRWRALRDQGVPIISRWIDTPDEHLDRELPPGFDFARLWHECVSDVLSCDTLVIYAEEGEVLKGAILELGIAIGSGKDIVRVGPNSAYLSNGTWMYYPGIEDWTHTIDDLFSVYTRG